MVHASRTLWTSLALGLGLLGCLTGLAPAADGTARVEVYFSPRGGATEAVIRAVNTATQQILVQAYSFTSAPIAQALVDAHKRGVPILAVLDTSNETGTYSAATFLVNVGIPTLIDDHHAIAHSKVMVIDRTTVITGSFNFSRAAEEKNVENLLVMTDAPELVQVYEANIRAHAAHAHPYTRPGTQASAGTAPAGTVRGNQRSKVYRVPRCKRYRDMISASVVSFPSEVAAQQAGYRKAKDCS